MFQVQRQLLALTVSCSMLAAGGAAAAEKDSTIYELRIYQASEGKVDGLLSRFRDHAVKLYEKHGATNVGAWTALDPADRRLVYLLSYPSADARDKTLKAFQADPEWKEASAKFEAACAVFDKKVQVFLSNAADYSPEIKPDAAGERIFELRTYTTTPGNLDRLNARFRNHTTKLFAKHGMTNVAYFALLPDQPGAENTLIYLLAHKSADAAKASFGEFRKDPDWIAAREASEKEAGSSLTVPDGVKSVYLKPTDFSPTK